MPYSYNPPQAPNPITISYISAASVTTFCDIPGQIVYLL